MDNFKKKYINNSYSQNSVSLAENEEFIYPERYNSGIRPYIKKGHKISSNKPVFAFNIKDLGLPNSLKNYSKCKGILDIYAKHAKKSGRLDQTVRTVTASIFLILFIVVMVFFSEVFGVGQSDVKFVEYDRFIWPVVMQDPEPFDEQNPPNFELMLNSSVWVAAANQQPNCLNSDNNGRVIISIEDVNKACNTLFGKDLQMFNEDSSLYMNFYEFDSNKKIFYVEAISNDRCFMPKTISLSNKNDRLVLKVGYFVPDHRDIKNEKVKMKKQMKYILRKNSKTGKFYISEIKPED